MSYKKIINGVLNSFWEANGFAKISIKWSLLEDKKTIDILSNYKTKFGNEKENDIVILSLNLGGIGNYTNDDFNIYFTATFKGIPVPLIVPYHSIVNLINEPSAIVLALPAATIPNDKKPNKPHLRIVK